jgi:hypothetical protein
MTTFGYEGEVSGVDISTVAFSTQQVDITPDVIVPGLLSRVQQLLSEEPNKKTLGPFKAMDANVWTIKMGTMAYLPFELLEPLLGADLTARQVFELETCTDLIDFLTVNLVQPTEERTISIPSCHISQTRIRRCGAQQPVILL